MALRDQPYIPLYIQDIMTDEKLNECSAATHGIYIKGIMCLMHKSEQYGKILLKQKYKQSESKCLNFANQLVKHLPYTVGEIASAIDELLGERVLYLDGDFICQKRMIKDNDISLKRSKSGKKGGESTQSKGNFAKAKSEANPESEYEYEDDIKSVNEKKEEPLLILPFDSLEFTNTWELWKEFRRKQHQFKYKHIVSEQAALKKLNNLAKGKEETAITAIEYSMSNGWRDFYLPKNDNNGKSRIENFVEANKNRDLNYILGRTEAKE